MQPVQSIKNQYRGINAHLHSYWQGVRGWNNFHNPHISFLMVALKRQLLPMGYNVDVEESLQIRRDDEYSRRPKSDLTIYDLDPTRFSLPPIHQPEQLSGRVVPLPVVWEDNPLSEKPYTALTLYQGKGNEIKRPVVWIEVLSPSNKRPGNDADDYVRKRNDLLRSGIVFVELDYLHETPATLAHIPHSTTSGNGHDIPQYPYRISVLDPRPNITRGWASINEFHVDDPIPTVVIPLNDDDRISFDFDIPYQKHFEDFLFGIDPDTIDYNEFPVNFARYSPDDQQRIALRMLAVLEAARDGLDLETGPFPVKDIGLEEALKALDVLQQR